MSLSYYRQLLENMNLNIYQDIRCGIAHAYLIEGGKNANIDIGFGNYGIEYNSSENRYTFYNIPSLCTYGRSRLLGYND
jgi:hypothetical protein